MKTKLLSMLALLLSLGVGLTNCNQVKDADLEETATHVVSNIQQAANINVTVNDHIATLSGTVEDEATKQQIESSVMAIEGVKSVINNIIVVPPPPVIEEPVEEEVSDQLIVATIKGKLNVHSKPGVQEHVLAVVAHGETLTLLEKTTDKWWLIETDYGLKGYCYSPYLEEL